jgi:hypothetical protein
MRNFIGLLCALSACAPDVAERDSHTVIDSAGIAIVESVAPEWGDSARIDPDPLARIGREEPGPYQFAFISHAQLLSDGTIAVADFSSAELRLFDAAGRHLASMGRPGEGPGEFRSITSVFEYAGDSVAVYDQRLRRLTVFDRAGGTPRTIPIQNDQNLDAFGMLADRTLLLYNPGQFRRGRPEGLQWDTTDIVAVRPADGTVRTIMRLPSRERLVGPDGQDRALVPLRWSIQGAADDGFWWSTGDRYEIAFYDTLGVQRRMIRRPVQPRPVADADLEAYRNAHFEQVRRFQGNAGVERARRGLDDGMVGDHVPLFSVAFVDRDRRLWVAESTWPDLAATPRRWSVFDPDGVWLGDVDAPPGLRFADARGDTVLGIWRDELDVQHVHTHRIITALTNPRS